MSVVLLSLLGGCNSYQMFSLAGYEQASFSNDADGKDELELDEPAPPPAPAGVDPAIHQEIVDTVARIEACYADSELPPAVMRLQGLVADRDYQAIRTSITEIWNELIKFHQQRGMRIQPQVTTTFNTINSIVRRA